MKQEEPKQETLEEFAKKSVEIYVNEREKQTAYLEIIRGAKWQQQQNKNLYSEGEVEYLLYSFKNYLGFGEEVNEKKWFEQFKKK